MGQCSSYPFPPKWKLVSSSLLILAFSIETVFRFRGYRFFRKGLQQGLDDHRCDSFMALLEKLKHLKNRPRYILLENVVGFEDSRAHGQLLSTLAELQYGYQVGSVNFREERYKWCPRLP